MMPVLIYQLKCDNCCKITEQGNIYEEGWIQVEGTISKGLNVTVSDKDVSAYMVQRIEASKQTHHFCCWECLIEHDDAKRDPVELVAQS